MKRDIIEQLVSWKNNTNRKPLILTGVRQSGKTFICKEFGNQYFEDVAYFVFENNERLASIFQYDFDTHRIVNELGNLIRGKNIVPGKTLVIFDEIQACPLAITSLKYFYEEMPELHIIAAGSLLGVAINRNGFSFPVGKVDRLQMYPMSFKEFLIASGKENLIRGLSQYGMNDALPQLYSLELEKEYRYYQVIGGMPEAVLSWITNRNLSEVEKIQDTLIEGYISDFAKHAPTVDIPKLGWIWESIPKQLAKENNKFVFSHVKAGKRSADLEDALLWLQNAGLIYKLNLCVSIQLPLSSYENTMSFKIYMMDIGILRRMAHISAKSILDDAPSLALFKGALTENFVMNELIQNGYKPYYWKSNNTAEIDFVLEYDDKIIPVEVKAATHTRAKSYHLFCQKYKPQIGFKLSLKNNAMNVVENTKTYSLPLYLIWRMQEYLEL